MYIIRAYINWTHKKNVPFFLFVFDDFFSPPLSQSQFCKFCITCKSSNADQEFKMNTFARLTYKV